MLRNLSRYWKAVVAVIGAVVAIGNAVVSTVDTGYGDGRWDAADTFAVVAAVVTAYGVYRKANTS